MTCPWPDPGPAKDSKRTPSPLNFVSRLLMGSATTTLSEGSVATPPARANCPLLPLLPNLFAKGTNGLPFESNAWTRLLFESTTKTLLLESVAIPIGRLNCCALEPAIPAWQLAVQTSKLAKPSETPYPQVLTKLCAGVESNF